jgi:hypothetical protein
MTSYFKLLGSQNEIKCLNVEIHRLATWMDDQENHMSSTYDQLTSTNPALASQLLHKLEYFMALNNVHHSRLTKLQALDGFTGDIRPGTRKGATHLRDEHQPGIVVDNGWQEEDSGDDSDGNNEDSTTLIDDTLEAILHTE